jgi:hypothetical protein
VLSGFGHAPPPSEHKNNLRPCLLGVSSRTRLTSSGTRHAFPHKKLVPQMRIKEDAGVALMQQSDKKEDWVKFL